MEMFLTSSIHAVAHDIAKKVDLSKSFEDMLKIVLFGKTSCELNQIDEIIVSGNNV